jgi:rod shape-determining protein MreB
MARQNANKKKGKVLHIGIDLGTSRSAVAASNGTREWIESYVGWPKDFVSRKALGKDIVFGSEALNNRLSLELFRPLQHGVIREGTRRTRRQPSP